MPCNIQINVQKEIINSFDLWLRSIPSICSDLISDDEMAQDRL